MNEQASLYWTISQAWYRHGSITVAFGVAVKSLRKIMEVTKNARMHQMAKALLDDIANNSASPEPPAA
jgi:hypothetical protein